MFHKANKIQEKHYIQSKRLFPGMKTLLNPFPSSFSRYLGIGDKCPQIPKPRDPYQKKGKTGQKKLSDWLHSINFLSRTRMKKAVKKFGRLFSPSRKPCCKLWHNDFVHKRNRSLKEVFFFRIPGITMSPPFPK